MERSAQIKSQSLVGQPSKLMIFICKKRLITWNRVNLHSPSSASLVSMLVHLHNISLRVSHPIKGDRMLF